MTGAWLREAQVDLAENRLLDAAERAFVERGVSKVGMGDIAEFAGCSRGTLYRYFKNRDELHMAYVARATRRISERVSAEIAAIEDPEQRLVEAILRSLRLVRANPGTAAWFVENESGLAARLSSSSAVLDTAASLFAGLLVDPDPDAASPSLRTRWLVRVIVSLLTLPGENEREERALVSRFVVPNLLRDSRT